MSRFAIVNENNTVINIAEADENFAKLNNWVKITDSCNIGDTFDRATGKFTSVYNSSVDEIKHSITVETQHRLDSFAQSRNYDSILSACTYATSTIPKFKAEGQYCVDMRDATWSKLYQIMEQVNSGLRVIPSSFADIESELPELVWPV